MPTYPTSIVTLDDVKDFLHIDSGDATFDSVLFTYIGAATRYATYVSDAIIPTVYTNEVHSGGSQQIVVFNTPILSVSSIIEYVGSAAYPLTEAEAGTNLTYGFSIDNASAGIISRRWNGMVGSFMAGKNNVVVTYTAGFATIPEDIVLAVLMDIQGLFTPSQYANLPGISDNIDREWTVNPINAFPRLASILTSSRRVPAVG